MGDCRVWRVGRRDIIHPEILMVEPFSTVSTFPVVSVLAILTQTKYCQSALSFFRRQQRQIVDKMLLRPSTPICLGRLRIACRYIFNLRQLRQGVDSLAQWLAHWIFIRADRVRIPQWAGNFSAMLHSFVATFMS